MVSAKLVAGSIVIVIALTVGGQVRAQTCASDADCRKGLRCQSAAGTTTPVATCTADSGSCKAGDPTVIVVMTCQAAPCGTDDDCGTDMVCHQQVSTTCTGSTPVAIKCDPNTACDAGEPVPVICTDTMTSLCAYRWEMPCSADADCGDGFTCKPSTYGTCTGSGGTATPTSGGASAGAGGGTGSTAAPVPPPNLVDGGVTCTVVSSYPGSCQAKPVACTAATDCPSGWTCSLSTGGIGIGAPTGAPTPIDGGVVVPPPVVVPAGTCQPPSTHGTYGGRGANDGNGGPTIGLADGGTFALSDAGAKQGSNTPPTPTVPVSGAGGSQQTGASTASGGGCSVGQGSRGELAWTLGALGALAIVLVRRRRG